MTLSKDFNSYRYLFDILLPSSQKSSNFQIVFSQLHHFCVVSFVLSHFMCGIASHLNVTNSIIVECRSSGCKIMAAKLQR